MLPLQAQKVQTLLYPPGPGVWSPPGSVMLTKYVMLTYHSVAAFIAHNMHRLCLMMNSMSDLSESSDMIDIDELMGDEAWDKNPWALGKDANQDGKLMGEEARDKKPSDPRKDANQDGKLMGDGALDKKPSSLMKFADQDERRRVLRMEIMVMAGRVETLIKEIGYTQAGK